MLYRTVWGPYINREDRKIVIVRLLNNKKKTISYARYLMEIKLNRYLEENEEVDHIDNNCTNDSIDNLQILTRMQNRNKTKRHQFRIEVECKFCKKKFLILRKRFELNQKKHKKDGPFCSRQCSGKVHH